MGFPKQPIDNNGSDITFWGRPLKDGETQDQDKNSEESAEDYEEVLKEYRQKQEEEALRRKIAPPPSDFRPCLKFGIEIEFCIAYLLPSGKIYDKDGYRVKGLPHNTDLDLEDGRIIRGVASIEPDSFSSELDSSVVAEICVLERQQEVFRHIINTLGKHGIACCERRVRYNDDEDDVDPFAWTLTQDTSINTSLEQEAVNYNFCSVELASPPLYNLEDSYAQVQKVLDILTETYRIDCENNPSCGLHVHVSSDWNPDPNPNPDLPAKWCPGFHPRNLANLMATLWVFEEVLETIHPEHRRKDGLWSYYCEPLCTRSQLARECNPDLLVDWKREGLMRILSLREENDCTKICSLCRPQLERLSYNTEHLRLRDPFDENKRTIEFRGAQASLDSQEVCSWIKVCTGLVEFAESVNENILDTFLQTHVDDKPGDFSVFELLCAIGRPNEAEYYDQKIRKRDQKEQPSTPKELNRILSRQDGADSTPVIQKSPRNLAHEPAAAAMDPDELTQILSQLDNDKTSNGPGFSDFRDVDLS